MSWLLIFCWLFDLIYFSQSSEKIPYSPGTICNFEAYYSGGIRAVNRFFCVPESFCRKGFHRFPLMHYDGCNSFMQSPHRDDKVESLVCCHQEEVLEDWNAHWNKLIYLPGVRSFMMCKEHSQAICGPQGSYCKEEEVPDTQTFAGLPTVISKYPHTALTGYFDSTKNAWNWFCLGSIVSKNFILTVWSCAEESGKPATNVKIGESRICPQDHCPNRDEEQNLVIVGKHRHEVSGKQTRHDLMLLEVAPVIQYNKNVRPACLFYQINTIQTQGWFARYSKPEILIKTAAGKRPLFTSPKYENIIALKVRTAGEARIFFSATGLPYRKQFYYEIVLGAEENAVSKFLRSDLPSWPRPPTPINITTNILSPVQFRGFWIHVENGTIRVGKEDTADHFLTYTDTDTDFPTSAMGVSTRYHPGDWVINDYRTLASLHDFEMQDSYTNDCKESLGDPTRPEASDDTMFCARNAHNRYAPCDNDWGGALQIQQDNFYCMWLIYGVFLRDDSTNCSEYVKPSLFKLLSKPPVLAWIEGVIFANFTISTVALEQPECTGPDTAFEGRCIKPLYPK